MCGIGGIVRFDGGEVDRDRLRRMGERLACRGPDSRGEVMGSGKGGGWGLVHRRLAVIDLADGGQPMCSGRGDGGKLWVVFNGEIYNHCELRRELEGFGYRFVTDHSDTEVLLHGYREWGSNLPAKLEGMFGFGVLDEGRQELFLARDRMGKKPVYYCIEDAERKKRFVFSSLVGGVLSGLMEKPDICREALRNYLRFGYTRDQSIFEGVRQLGAGMWMKVDGKGNVKSERYWELLGVGDNDGCGVEDVERLIVEGVRQRLEADVDLGCFLSGGVDSSLVAAIGQRLLTERGERLRTFSVSMGDARYDEGVYARRVAEHIGSEHHELRAMTDIEGDMKKLVAEIGEPFGDSSVLPTYWVSKATREYVKVAMSGDGGDEMFGGYDRYRGMRILAKYGGLLKWLPVGMLRGNQKSKRSRLKRMVSAARRAGAWERYVDIVGLFNDATIDELGMTGGVFGEMGDDKWVEMADMAESARRWDVVEYLPHDLLRKVDRASMAVGLEVRCPLLNQKVCECAIGISMGKHVVGRRSKAVLKDVAGKYLPRDIVQRRKMGFAVPIGEWFSGELEGMLRGYLLDGGLAEIGDGYNRMVVKRIIDEHVGGRRDHTHRLFALLSLSMWWEWVKSEGNGN